MYSGCYSLQFYLHIVVISCRGTHRNINIWRNLLNLKFPGNPNIYMVLRHHKTVYRCTVKLLLFHPYYVCIVLRCMVYITYLVVHVQWLYTCVLFSSCMRVSYSCCTVDTSPLHWPASLSQHSNITSTNLRYTQ